MTVALRAGACVFAIIALAAGVLQLWAYAQTDGPRHLILGVFAVAVGLSVTASVVRDVRRRR